MFLFSSGLSRKMGWKKKIKNIIDEYTTGYFTKFPLPKFDTLSVNENAEWNAKEFLI